MNRAQEMATSSRCVEMNDTGAEGENEVIEVVILAWLERSTVEDRPRVRSCPMRLFVAITLPPGAIEAVHHFPRPDLSSIRWTTPEQWHVTLRFIGDVSDPASLSEALLGLGSAHAQNSAPVHAVMGPASAWFPGGAVLQVPVAGLDDIAGEVTRVTASWGQRPDHREFNGHLTLARSRRKEPGTPELAGIPIAAQWPVRQITLYSSVLGTTGAVYDAMTVVDL